VSDAASLPGKGFNTQEQTMKEQSPSNNDVCNSGCIGVFFGGLLGTGAGLVFCDTKGTIGLAIIGALVFSFGFAVLTRLVEKYP
jgi:hypothetical protein